MGTLDKSFGRDSAQEQIEREQLNHLQYMVAGSEIKAEIVRLLLQGLQRKQIADATGRSTHTVDGHIKQLYIRLGIGDRAKLMLLASRLVDPPPVGGWHLRE